MFSCVKFISCNVTCLPCRFVIFSLLMRNFYLFSSLLSSVKITQCFCMFVRKLFNLWRETLQTWVIYQVWIFENANSFNKLFVYLCPCLFVFKVYDVKNIFFFSYFNTFVAHAVSETHNSFYLILANGFFFSFFFQMFLFFFVILQ